jgi:hypothetical protein
MSEVTIIGNDLIKRVFHLHGARVDGFVRWSRCIWAEQAGSLL